MSYNRTNITTLDQVCEVIDSLHKSPKYVESGYPMIRVKDMFQGYLKIDNPAYVTKEVYEEFTRKHKPKKGDILFSRVGSYGITTFVDKDIDFCLGQNTVVMTNYNNEIIDNIFLYYMLISNIVKEQIEKLVTGSTQKTISMKSIKGLELPLPNITEQKAIADILSSLDDKIELNNQMNETLEEIAKALFKRWFVDFEFPNEEGQPYKSSGGKMIESELGFIPEDWCILKLEDIGEVVAGGTPSTKCPEYYDGDIPWITPKDLSGYNRKFIEKGGRSITELGLQKSSAKIMPEGAVLFSSRAPIGYITIASRPLCTNQGFKSIVCNKKYMSQNYIYYLLKQETDKILSIASGSTFKEVSGTTMKNYKIIVPPLNILEKFDNVIKANDKLLTRNYVENDLLTEIRDTLLPKLMSGEVRVSDFEE